MQIKINTRALIISPDIQHISCSPFHVIECDTACIMAIYGNFKINCSVLWNSISEDYMMWHGRPVCVSPQPAEIQQEVYIINQCVRPSLTSSLQKVVLNAIIVLHMMPIPRASVITTFTFHLPSGSSTLTESPCHGTGREKELGERRGWGFNLVYEQSLMFPPRNFRWACHFFGGYANLT